MKTAARKREVANGLAACVPAAAKARSGATTNVAYAQPRPIKANGIELVHDIFGEPEAPALVLIAGLGCQMITWDDRFCAQLAARGYRVIRFDNRDVGLSTRLDNLGVPNVRQMMSEQWMGFPEQSPYTLCDMAADTVGLFDALGIDAAHVVGVSMGGAIGQELAIHWPQRLRSLTSIMSNTGEIGFPKSSPEAMSVLLTPPPKERKAFCSDYALRWRTLRGPGFPEDEAEDLLRAQRVFDRGVSTSGMARQLAAIIAAPGRRRALAEVRLPALVIHGDADPLVNVEGGRATARAIPGAKLNIIEGMGHALPICLWPRLVDAIARHAI